MAHMNCWEFYDCPNERRQSCSAFINKAGRKCWMIAGTLCEGKAHGVRENKISDCYKCDFYIQVTARRA